MVNIEEMNARMKKGFVSHETFLETIKKDLVHEYPQRCKSTKWNAATQEIETTTAYNIPCAFDIETTQYAPTKTAYMYIWQFAMNGVCTYGRTWREFAELIRDICHIYNTGMHNQLIIYVHNLSFEMSFLLPRLKHIANVFAIHERVPLKVVIYEGIEFRDSLKLSGLNLDKTAQSLTKFKFNKMVGDLDYDKMRNSKTPMTEKEMNYCLQDVTTLSAYIYEQILQYDGINNIPMTNTGRVRQYTREKCLYRTNKKGKKVSNRKYREKMSDLIITEEEYNRLKNAYAGGYTHASHTKVGRILPDVHSYDFTSSYPAVMVSCKMPMSSGEQVHYNTFAEYYNDIRNDYLILGTYELKNVNDEKFPYEHYISSSKCLVKENYIEDNGRIVSADRIIIETTEHDFEIIKNTYNFESAKIIRAIRYKAGYLPKEFIQCVLDLYKDKTTLKGVSGKEAEYMLKKGMLNSLYGMSGTDIVRALITYTKGINEPWNTEPADFFSAIEKNNKNKKRFIFFPWAVWITACARYNLWQGIIELKGDYAYADTDSVKYLNYDKHQKFFEEYNQQITEKIYAVCDFYKISREYAHPLTVDGKKKPIGVWDYEGKYEQFKTLGAKRYMYIADGKYHITIAGINKKTGCKYISEIQKEKDPFDFFDYGMIIPKEYSGKTAINYTDKHTETVITDAYGNTETMTEEGCAYIYESEYNMNVYKIYYDYLASGQTETSDLKKWFASIASRYGWQDIE